MTLPTLYLPGGAEVSEGPSGPVRTSRTGRTLPPCTLQQARSLLDPSWTDLRLSTLCGALGWDTDPVRARALSRLWKALEAWQCLKEALAEDACVVYLAGPLRGDGSQASIAHNQARMALLARFAQSVLPRAALVVPHLNFAFLNETGAQGLWVRRRVLEACEALVRRCDAMIVASEAPSEGVRREMAVARERGLPLFRVPGWDPPRDAAWPQAAG